MSTNTIKRNNIGLSAGIDIGSNATRLVIASISNSKIDKLIINEKRSTRLATGIHKSGKLTDQHIDIAITSLKELYDIAITQNVSNIRIVATSAVREASNGHILIEKAKDIGIDIEVISGEEEANLTLLGVKSVIENLSSALIFDIGGGSTEFILTPKSDDYNDDEIVCKSYKIGVVKLADMFNIQSDRDEDVLACQKYVDDYISNISFENNPKMLVATAGTATTIAQIALNLKHYNSDQLNGYVLNIKKIEEIYLKILSTPIDKRELLIGIENDRLDLIIPGSMLLIAIMKKFNFNEVTVSDYALRHGVAISAYK